MLYQTNMQPGIPLFLLLAYFVGLVFAQQDFIEDNRLRRSTKKLSTDPATDIVWKDAYDLTLGGLAFPRDQLESPFDRLPASAKSSIPEGVWNQSIESAGVFVEFQTDATEIWVNYTILSTCVAMWNIESAAVSGVDIFAMDVKNGIYRWIGQWEEPKYALNMGLLVDGLAFSTTKTQYRIHLPLYNRVGSFAIGVPTSARFFEKLLDSETVVTQPPVIWYGTSIAQGKSASVPSAAYMTQINLALFPHINILNFGFSSNGKMDESVMVYLNSIKPARAFIIDCLPNMATSDVANRTVPTVTSIKKTHLLDTLVVLVESAVYGEEWYNAGMAKSANDKRNALKNAYNELIAEGFTDLFYVSSDQLIGPIVTTASYQVDGTHPNDLGMSKMATFWQSYLASLLNLLSDKQNQ